MLEWLPLLTLPTCAVASALVVGVIRRHEELEDGALLRQFILVLVIGVGALYETAQTPAVALRLHPELQLKADVEADPIYKTLLGVGPEYAKQFLAVLVTEQATSATLPRARLQARSVLAALATNRLGFADQATRVAYGQVIADSLRELRALSADECYAALSGRALDRETLAHGFSASNTMAFESAALKVLDESPGIMTRGQGPTRVPRALDAPVDFNATMLEYQRIADEVAQVYGRDVSTLLTGKRFPQSPPMSADTVCAARIYELDAMLQRPQPAAALLIDAALR